ncbi:MAG: hypothetical protein ACOCX2_15500 [Armatimonadota bacterium]
MQQADGRSFRTGPQMVNPGFGLVLALGCLVLAATQAWPVIEHVTGGRVLAAYEPAARAVFAVVLLLAGTGIGVALLEQRNARVEIRDDTITIANWRASRLTLQCDQIEELALIRPAQEDTDLPFHWLFVRAADGRGIRLAGGPWPEPRPVEMLRHELVDRLDLTEDEPQRADWALIFAARRRTWS